TCSLYKRSPLASMAESDAAVVQFTATVGGDPKGVVRSTDNLTAAAAAIGKTLNIKGTDRVLCTVPLHHSYGFDFGVLASLAHGATLFLEDEISPKRIAKLLREQAIDIFPGTPALFGSLVRVPTVKPLKIAGARYLSTQAGPLAIDRPGKDPATVGKPFDNVELRVASPRGERLATGDAGPIW